MDEWVRVWRPDGRLIVDSQADVSASPEPLDTARRSPEYAAIGDQLSFRLCRWPPVRNGGATSEVVVTESRLPVLGNDKLRTIQELRSIQESPGEVGAIEHRLEKVR